MTQKNVNQFFSDLRQNQALQQRLKSIRHPEIFLQVTKEFGYSFTLDDLQLIALQLPEEGLAAILNPGIAPRRHLMPM